MLRPQLRQCWVGRPWTQLNRSRNQEIDIFKTRFETLQPLYLATEKAQHRNWPQSHHPDPRNRADAWSFSNTSASHPPGRSREIAPAGFQSEIGSTDQSLCDSHNVSDSLGGPCISLALPARPWLVYDPNPPSAPRPRVSGPGAGN